jgi:regulator of protease activity HflC (stomatin/prohibitin superfamily)
MNNTGNAISTGLILVALFGGGLLSVAEHFGAATVVCLFFLFLSACPRQISEWQRGIKLRFGRFHRVLEPGISWVIPGVDQVSDVVDMRIRSTSFSAEKTLTSDTVPVNVDAVLFWVVTDAKQAVIEVEDYLQTISWAAQTTLRDVIGQTELVGMISDRKAIDEELRKIIDAKTSDWGITVQSVEIRDMKIPGALEDAMSRKAQADREKEARIILAESELKVAEEMEKAAKVYHDDPIALQIRAMNMTYESIKERGALMVVPSDMVHSMNGVVSMGASCFERDPVAN